jgi:hypothetical protein
MRRKEIVEAITGRRAELIERFAVKSLALFGSVARDEDRPDSDVDVLVEFNGPATFDRYMGLKLFLEELLQTRVDLVTQRALKPRMRPRVEQEAVYVA